MINLSLEVRLEAVRNFAVEAPAGAVSDLEAVSAQAQAPFQAREPVGVALPVVTLPVVTAVPVDLEEADARDIGRGLQAGDTQALAQLYDLYAPGLFRLLVAMLGNSADAEDALQETFVKIASHSSRRPLLPLFGKLGHARDWRSYLLVAARHEALSMLRRRGRELQMAEEAEWEQLPDERQPVLSGQVFAHDWQRLLRRLPLEQREVVVLKVWEQMTFLQIARVVQVSPNTVMSRYRYAIERLRTWCQQADREEAHEEAHHE